MCTLIHVHLSTSHQLSNHQWGFCNGRSTSDVPQGSVQGPLGQPLSDGASLILYVDDVFFQIINTSEDFAAVQSDVDQIDSWSTYLTISEAKCEYMVKCRKRTPSEPLSPLLLTDCPLERVDIFEYLVVLLLCDLPAGATMSKYPVPKPGKY